MFGNKKPDRDGHYVDSSRSRHYRKRNNSKNKIFLNNYNTDKNDIVKILINRLLIHRPISKFLLFCMTFVLLHL